MESIKLFPTCERMTDRWISTVEEHEPDNQIVMYHKALETAESQIEKLESEKRELEEDNKRLRELLPEAFEAGIVYGGDVIASTFGGHEIEALNKEEWLEKHNIKL